MQFVIEFVSIRCVEYMTIEPADLAVIELNFLMQFLLRGLNCFRIFAFVLFKSKCFIVVDVERETILVANQPRAERCCTFRQQYELLLCRFQTFLYVTTGRPERQSTTKGIGSVD